MIDKKCKCGRKAVFHLKTNNGRRTTNYYACGYHSPFRALDLKAKLYVTRHLSHIVQ